MPDLKDKAIGVIVYYKSKRTLKFLILKHKKGHWSFAKGHSEKGESPLQTAKRELKEEAGIKNVKFISEKVLLNEKYTFKKKSGRKVYKSVDYFIAGVNSDEVKIDFDEIMDYRWRSLNQSEKLLTYKLSQKTLEKAKIIIINFLKKLNKI